MHVSVDVTDLHRVSFITEAAAEKAPGVRANAAACVSRDYSCRGDKRVYTAS